MKDFSLHQLSSYNNLSHFLHKCFQLGDNKPSLKPKIQRTDFSCLTHVLQEYIMDRWRSFLKNQERFLFQTAWNTKTSFSFEKCVMDEEIKALSHVPFFRDPKPKNRETCSLISRVCLQQSDDHVGGFIKFDFLRLKVVK